MPDDTNSNNLEITDEKSPEQEDSGSQTSPVDHSIVARLRELAGSVTVTEDLSKFRYTFRLEIPARTVTLPNSQNIPSNLAVRKGAGTATGTFRPPITSSRGIGMGKDEIESEIESMIPDEFDVLLTDTQGPKPRYRPHVHFENESIDVTYECIRSMNQEYAEVFDSDR